jgi:hypothetical protein
MTRRVTPTPGEQWREAQERRPAPKADQPSDAEIFGTDPETCPACGGNKEVWCKWCSSTGTRAAATADGAAA